MLELGFAGVRNVLCLGAHADDIEIGCGGTLLKLAQARPDLNFLWVVCSGEGRRAAEARRSAGSLLQSVARKKIEIRAFRASYFPYHAQQIKDYFERIKDRFEPDLIFTHHRDDRHQDHRVLSDLAWNTFRRHWILEYEILKYDGDLGQPTTFVPLDEASCQLKIATILGHFKTQRSKHWFTADAFWSLLRIRGVECGRRFAEAFYCRKLAL
jgi:LmbE family N-acetylglucosaminyl deacetylase